MFISAGLTETFLDLQTSFTEAVQDTGSPKEYPYSYRKDQICIKLHVKVQSLLLQYCIITATCSYEHSASPFVNIGQVFV